MKREGGLPGGQHGIDSNICVTILLETSPGRPSSTPAALAWLFSLALAACTQPPPRSDASTQALARAVAETAARAAVAKPGAKVCRLIHVAIAEREWIRGEVVGVGEKTVRIRIDEPSRYQQALNGTVLAKGAVVEDSPMEWTPCR